MKNIKKWLAYLLYVIALALVFLYVCFPSEAVVRYAEQRINAAFCGVEADIGSLGPGLPPAIVAEDIEITYKDTKTVLVNRLAVSPSYADLVMGKRFFNVYAEAAEGIIQGLLGIKEASGNSTEISLNLDLKDIQIEEFNRILSLQVGHFVEGGLEGKIEYTGPPDVTGNGNAVLDLRKCRVRFNSTFYGMEELEFRSGKAVAEMKNRRVTISEFSLEGSQFSVTGSGNIMLALPVENSKIRLSARIAPHQALFKSIGGMLPAKYKREGEIPVRLTGTLGNPGLSLR
ncbi:MAG: type II secretion system protein GspN [Desulfobacteraceae bacterium]|nr:type II secretion system protein GspN [Desulfobacteraceae bacterium]